MGSEQSTPAHATPGESSGSPAGMEEPMNATSATNETSESSAAVSESKCPMHNADGSYSFDWFALMRPSFPHGPGGNKPISESEAEQLVNGSSSNQEQAKAAAAQAPPVSQCPVKHQEYNVYSQPLDPTNQMPRNPNQLPAAVQTRELSTDRVKSNIPKGGASEGTTWTYPSPQMFYNSLARKGKLGDTQEEDMESVVALHNNMNEKTWKAVLAWEQATSSSSESPKLLKFIGRPQDLSPKALLKHYMLGHPLPYDRHDWTVLRADGTTVRYVIDYYYDESRAREDTQSSVPSLEDEDATPSLLIDVRPALDGPQNLFDRAIRMPLAQHVFQSTKYTPLPLSPTATMRNQVSESVQVWKAIQGSAVADEPKLEMSDEEAAAFMKDFAKALVQCKAAKLQMDQCQSDGDCAKASLNLTVCMGKAVCPLQQEALTNVLQKADGENDVDAALQRLSDCVSMRSSQYDQLTKN